MKHVAFFLQAGAKSWRLNKPTSREGTMNSKPLQALRRTMLGSTALLALLATAPIMAAEAEAPPQNPDASATSDQSANRTKTAPEDLAEIVVTARRRQEKLNDVPVAVSAMTGDDLRQNRIESSQDLQNYIPSMNVSTGVTQDSGIQIRGMGATGGFSTVIAGGGTGVVSYFGDAVANMNERSLYYDLDNVQVIKGPQGTLFGKNTTGGVDRKSVV